MPTAPVEGIALLTANTSDRIALRGVRLRCRLSGMSQRTTIEQTFVNLERHAIEAIYTFPLPESAAVCGFEVVTGDRVLTGKVEETDDAIEQYEEAVSEGHGAYLMEQERADVFTVRVGNLKPGQAATVRLTYVCALERADKSIRVAFPTTVAPRYVTATGSDPLDAAIDGDAVNPPHVLHVPYGLSMEVDVDLGRELRGVYSPSHSVRVDRNGDRRATVTLAGGVTEMNRDVVLNVDLAKEHEPAVEAERWGRDGAVFLAVTFVPEFDEDELVTPEPSETVFVLDCSGSMQGDSIRQATAALELCLRSLSPGDTFNVCRFGSTFETMASEPLAYGEETLKRALNYVRQDADLGGTELYAPLEAIFKTAPQSGRVRQIILLTDGQVSNEAAVIDLARQHRNRNRIFSFGIGAACSANLVKGIARATGGAAEFITAGERIDEKVLRTFGRLASPMVSDVAIDWDGCDVQTLAELPPVFDGDVLAVFGRSPGRMPKTVTLTCKTAAGLKRWSVAVPAAADHDDGTIATMWARRTIQSLEEVNDVRRSRARKQDRSREQQLMLDLSKQFNLLCSLTTFIAVEHRSVEERNNGMPEQRRVPVQLAKGWGAVEALACAMPGTGLARMILSDVAPAAAAPPAPRRRQSLADRLLGAVGLSGSAETAKRKKSATQLKHEEALKTMAEGRYEAKAVRSSVRDLSEAARPGETGGRAHPTPAAKPAAPDALRLLLSLQSADGWFDWSDHAAAVAQFAGYDPAAWRSQVEATLPPLASGTHREHVVNTALVLTLLTIHFPDGEALWRRAYQKACRHFLAKALTLGPAEVEAWLAELRQKLAPAKQSTKA